MRTAVRSAAFDMQVQSAMADSMLVFGGAERWKTMTGAASYTTPPSLP
jgi:hypothetical protein